VGLRHAGVALLTLLARCVTHPETMSPEIVGKCQMPKRQIDALVAEARASGIDLVASNEAATAGKGRVLVVEIANAVDGADGYGGRQVALFGRLLQDGSEVASFYARRTTNKGLWSGYRTVCAALNHCQDVLGKDIVPWLKNPTSNAHLGEH
jgi:hypothetical protein